MMKNGEKSQNSYLKYEGLELERLLRAISSRFCRDNEYVVQNGGIVRRSSQCDNWTKSSVRENTAISRRIYQTIKSY
jgi:hypothetical protein